MIVKITFRFWNKVLSKKKSFPTAVNSLCAVYLFQKQPGEMVDKTLQVIEAENTPKEKN